MRNRNIIIGGIQLLSHRIIGAYLTGIYGGPFGPSNKNKF